ncbi:unnamed protein product [Trichogramma brassicae]|uniref:Uncharacterized protein n=1 Tax=Trichogramma brassicae TaxID=86971 RepID=A0A6H5IR61_9HYME|nr:unnamed protein product [Trichogramma brassicae]
MDFSGVYNSDVRVANSWRETRRRRAWPAVGWRRAASAHRRSGRSRRSASLRRRGRCARRRGTISPAERASDATDSSWRNRPATRSPISSGPRRSTAPGTGT